MPELHLWDLDPPPERVAELRAHLGTEERVRADRFLVSAVGRRFTVARGSLRELLGGRLGIPPEAVEFAYGPQGKPWLPGRPDLHFNLSHSGERALVGLADRDIGVDIEEIRPDVEFRRLAERFFSEPERRELQKVPDEDLPLAFFRLWTRKEAYLKACGTGMAMPLADFAVPLGPLPDLTPMLWAKRPGSWRIRDVDCGPGYVGALCV